MPGRSGSTQKRGRGGRGRGRGHGQTNGKSQGSGGQVGGGDSNRPPPICKFFLEGRCNRGSRCRFRHELDDAYYASIDENHDGMWSYAGLNGMMVILSDVDEFMMDQEEQWKFDKDENPELKREDEFVELNLATFEGIVGPSMRERGLTVAHGVTRRMCEENGLLPPMFRITRVSKEDMSELLAIKESGNQKFMTGMFKEAFDSYEKALDCVAVYDFYVAPLSQMDEIVKILSNQAECQLRLCEYKDAARVATDALILDSDHEKSRIRRAKAELELYKIDQGSLMYLVQAKHDLEEVLNSPDSSNIGRKTSRTLLVQTKELLDRERQRYEEESRPETDFKFDVLWLRSLCW